MHPPGTLFARPLSYLPAHPVAGVGHVTTIINRHDHRHDHHQSSRPSSIVTAIINRHGHQPSSQVPVAVGSRGLECFMARPGKPIPGKTAARPIEGFHRRIELPSHYERPPVGRCVWRVADVLAVAPWRTDARYHIPSHTITCRHTPSHAVTRSNTPSHAVTRRHTPSHAVTRRSELTRSPAPQLRSPRCRALEGGRGERALLSLLSRRCRGAAGRATH